MFGTVGGLAQILAMMTLPILRKRYGCKKILVGAIGATLVGYTLLFVLGSLNVTNIVLLCGAAVIIFLGFGLATVLTTIFLADTVDYGEWKHQQRNESVIFSLQTFVVKLASAISVFIAGIGLDIIGLNKDAVVQSPQTLLGLRILMIIVPMLGLSASIIFFVKKYKLDEAMLTQITRDLKQGVEIND